jgi:hypothetical protein
MQFQKATKYGAKVRLALIGPAGSGKTYSALAIGEKLGAKVAVIDTEHGSASKYADRFGFDVLTLESFAPDTYVEAIKAAEAAGYDVLVIDSLSHAWMGKDGALEQVDRAAAKSRSQNTYTAWRDVTPMQTRMMDTIIACKMHLIATMRSKTAYELEERNGKKVPVKVGLAPIQRDGTEFEFDVVGEMDQDNNLLVTKTRCPALSGKMIARPGGELAKTLLEWVAGEAAPEKAAQASQKAAGATGSQKVLEDEWLRAIAACDNVASLDQIRDRMVSERFTPSPALKAAGLAKRNELASAEIDAALGAAKGPDEIKLK